MRLSGNETTQMSKHTHEAFVTRHQTTQDRSKQVPSSSPSPSPGPLMPGPRECHPLPIAFELNVLLTVVEPKTQEQ